MRECACFAACFAMILFPPVSAVAGPQEKVLYCCDFEKDTGIFRLVASAMLHSVFLCGALLSAEE